MAFKGGQFAAVAVKDADWSGLELGQLEVQDSKIGIVLALVAVLHPLL